jgi:predicted enzyme related to lactoylglutathione lyase
MITKFDGVSLWSSDLQILLPFYRDILGFEVMLDSPRFVILGGAGAGLCIGSHSEVHGRPTDPHRWLIRVDSDDIQGDVARLRAAGVEIVQEPNPEPDGPWLATVKDPEGNLVQLNYWEPGWRPEGQ